MTDIEKKAREYAKNAIGNTTWTDIQYRCEGEEAEADFAKAFLAGAAYALAGQWRDIPTDKDGFGDADAIDNITLPIVVRYQDGYVFTVNYDWGEEADWYNDILNHPDRFMWLPIPEYKPKGE